MQDPIQLFLQWYQEASEKVKHPESMFLATATQEGKPSLRTVLYRGLSQQSPRFFTNYQSRKGHELTANPQAALLFYWEPLERQVRFEGKIEVLSPEESDQYFQARPRGHRINALASPQSQPIESREVLLQKQKQLEAQLEGQEVPRPAHWGGYRLVPQHIEFWIQEQDRFHQRQLFTRTNTGWEASILAP
jgi:pyridoxamine 5'-phosphate oxidase